MRISPHLCFDGQCRSAFEFYHQTLGGSLKTMLSYGQSPMASQIDPKWHDRIVHATLELDDVELTGVDQLPHEFQKPQGFFVTLTLADVTRARSVFEALSKGGEQRLAFEPTFWSPGFGVVIDRFGIPWEINTAGHDAPK